MKRVMTTSLAMVGLAAGSVLLGSVLTTNQTHAGDSHYCSNATLHGSYGFYRAGGTPLGTLAAIGLIIFDGNGGDTGTQSISKGGNYDFDIDFGPGQTYVVNADCTGRGFRADGIEFFRLVVLDGGQGFYIFSESAGNAVYGVGRRTTAPQD